MPGDHLHVVLPNNICKTEKNMVLENTFKFFDDTLILKSCETKHCNQTIKTHYILVI